MVLLMAPSQKGSNERATHSAALTQCAIAVDIGQGRRPDAVNHP